MIYLREMQMRIPAAYAKEDKFKWEIIIRK